LTKIARKASWEARQVMDERPSNVKMCIPQARNVFIYTIAIRNVRTACKKRKKEKRKTTLPANLGEFPRKTRYSTTITSAHAKGGAAVRVSSEPR
jgi:hypothetical protein